MAFSNGPRILLTLLAFGLVYHAQATSNSLSENNSSEGGNFRLRQRKLQVTCDTTLPSFGSQDTDVAKYLASPSGFVTGERRKWHKINIGFRGPQTCEEDIPNPFTYYRLDVTFTHSASGKTYVVPGYFAADGDSANTGATFGNVWLVHFTPSETGRWDWSADFKRGVNVAQNGGGTSAGFFDGESGWFNIGTSNKSGRDHRGKGMLEYVGEHHLRFAEGEWFLKAGADSPENLLAYIFFDGTPNNGGFRKSWQPHLRDWNGGDPTWRDGRGKQIIGAINYLAEQEMNAFSFLTMNINGDDKNVFPYISDRPGDRTRIDVSKTAQWEVLFEHADKMGLFMHFKTQEIENDHLLDNGNLGLERKLYYRELIARFSHHHALNWNIGEENSNIFARQRDFADFFKDNDPYKHPVVIHTWPTQKEEVYGRLVGNNDYDGASLQSQDVFDDTLEWRTRSAAAGHPWVVCNDEQNPHHTGIMPDADSNHAAARREFLYGNLMAGGAGVEYYFGYAYDCSDLTCQDYRTRENMWEFSRYALDFFNDNGVPFWEMENANSIVTNGNWALKQYNDEHIVVYLKEGGTTTVDLPGPADTYSIAWYNPRQGGALQAGSRTSQSTGNNRDIGNAPNQYGQDWLVLLRRGTGGGGGAGGGGAGDPDIAVASLVLIDDDTNEEIATLRNGDVFPSSIVNNKKVEISAMVEGDVESVVFDLNGEEGHRIDDTNRYKLRNIDSPGVYSVTATPYTQNGGGGDAGQSVSLTFTIGDAGLAIDSMILQDDADSFRTVATLRKGGRVSLPRSVLSGSLSVRVMASDDTESVVFDLNGEEAKIDNTYNYVLRGKMTESGTYTVSATPFASDNGAGTRGATWTSTITIG